MNEIANLIAEANQSDPAQPAPEPTVDEALAAEEAAEAAEPAVETVEPPPEPEPAAEPAAQPVVHPTVPLVELQSERQARQFAEATANDLRARMVDLEARIPKPEEKIPDPEMEPLEFIQHKLGDLANADADIKQQLLQSNAQSEQTRAAAHVQGLEQQYAQEHPEYYQAYNHLITSRLGEYRVMGLDDAAAQKTVTDEARWMIQNALQSGQNPASVVHQMALGRGFAAKGNGSGSEGQPAVAAALSPQATTLKQVARGIEQSQTLANTPGAAPKGAPTPEDALSMKDSEFDAMTDEQWKEMWET